MYGCIAMTVRDPHRHSSQAGKQNCEPGKVMDVAVHCIIWPMVFEYPQKVASILKRTMRIGAGNNLTAMGFDLLVVKTGFGGVRQKVELETILVQPAQHMHEPRLHPAGIHTAHHV